MPPSPELRRGRASVTPESGSWRSCLALKRIAQRPPTECVPFFGTSRIVDYQHRGAATNEPIRLNEQLCLQWRRVPDASRNK